MKKVKLNKLILYIVSLLIIIIFMFCLIMYLRSKSELKDGPIKLSKGVSVSKKYDTLDIVDIKGEVRNGENHITFYLVNNTKETVDAKNMKIEFLSKDKKVLYEASGLLTEVAPGERQYFDYLVGKNVLDAYTFVVKDEVKDS